MGNKKKNSLYQGYVLPELEVVAPDLRGETDYGKFLLRNNPYNYEVNVLLQPGRTSTTFYPTTDFKTPKGGLNPLELKKVGGRRRYSDIRREHYAKRSGGINSLDYETAAAALPLAGGIRGIGQAALNKGQELLSEVAGEVHPTLGVAVDLAGFANWNKAGRKIYSSSKESIEGLRGMHKASSIAKKADVRSVPQKGLDYIQSAIPGHRKNLLARKAPEIYIPTEYNKNYGVLNSYIESNGIRADNLDIYESLNPKEMLKHTSKYRDLLEISKAPSLKRINPQVKYGEAKSILFSIDEGLKDFNNVELSNLYPRGGINTPKVKLVDELIKDGFKDSYLPAVKIDKDILIPKNYTEALKIYDDHKKVAPLLRMTNTTNLKGWSSSKSIGTRHNFEDNVVIHDGIMYGGKPSVYRAQNRLLNPLSNKVSHNQYLEYKEHEAKALLQARSNAYRDKVKPILNLDEGAQQKIMPADFVNPSSSYLNRDYLGDNPIVRAFNFTDETLDIYKDKRSLYPDISTSGKEYFGEYDQLGKLQTESGLPIGYWSRGNYTPYLGGYKNFGGSDLLEFKDVERANWLKMLANRQYDEKFPILKKDFSDGVSAAGVMETSPIKIGKSGKIIGIDPNLDNSNLYLNINPRQSSSDILPSSSFFNVERGKSVYPSRYIKIHK